MSLLDRAFYLLDSASSPQNFTIILDLRDVPDLDRFETGARSALNRFPLSACSVASREWVWPENRDLKIETSQGEGQSRIERFIDERFDLRRQPSIKQMLVLSGSSARLVTRFHHAAADGLSAALWLGHQLNVAYEFETAQRECGRFDGPVLRGATSSVRRSRFAFEGASDPVRSSGSKRSGSRRWATICFDARELQRACRRTGGFTYHALLAACALEVITEWNNKKSKIGLWVPMNVRREARVGFGNGTSRIRVYANYDRKLSLTEKCRTVREQVAWTTKHGEWVVPEIPSLMRLPDSIAAPLLRGYLKLPQIDMATAVFTHVGSLLANAEGFKHVERIECVGLLHTRQRLAINAATHLGYTYLTLTYDPALLTAADVERLAQLFSEQIHVARRELS
jgi:hypothetical protein